MEAASVSAATLVLELDPSHDDTWLYVGSSGSALLTGAGTAAGLLEGPVRWSGRAHRTDRWETEVEGAIHPEGEDAVAFSVSGFLIDGPGEVRAFRGGMRFRTGHPAHPALNTLYCPVTGTFDPSTGRLRLEATT
jgi:hypothetical protein